MNLTLSAAAAYTVDYDTSMNQKDHESLQHQNDYVEIIDL